MGQTYVTLVDMVEGKSYELNRDDKARCTIGRSRDCIVTVGRGMEGTRKYPEEIEEKVPYISRLHCEIWYDNDGLVYLVPRGKNSTHIGPEDDILETPVFKKTQVPLDYFVTLVGVYSFKLVGGLEGKELIKEKDELGDTQVLDEEPQTSF
ncbi:MAG: FHA domain-containing protein [archaeon]